MSAALGIPMGDRSKPISSASRYPIFDIFIAVFSRILLTVRVVHKRVDVGKQIVVYADANQILFVFAIFIVEFCILERPLQSEIGSRVQPPAP